MRAYHQLIYRTIDKKLVTCGLFLDFSKAFGTVDHKILLSKLCHYRIRGGIPYNWFQNYLHNRTQFVKIGSIQSNPETITWGILQAATLGPLLFLLYINDLPYSSKKKTILSYFKNRSALRTCVGVRFFLLFWTLLVKGTLSRGFCCFRSILCYNHYFKALIINKKLL